MNPTPSLDSLLLTLLAEFSNSWMLFEFTEVRPCNDPKDMFFATVTPVDQVLKP